MKAKKLTGIVLIILLVFPSLAGAAEFPDIPYGYWGAREINEMSGLGYVRGMPDGKFYPENPITRAEFAALVVKALKLQVKAGEKPAFSDVSKGHWAYGVIDTVSREGFVSGNKGRYRPEDKISRQEMAAIVMKISSRYGYAGDGSTSFLGKYKDIEEIAPWAAPAVSDASRFGYMSEVSYSVYEHAYGSSRFNRLWQPQDNATRGQAVVAIYKVLVKTGLQ